MTPKGQRRDVDRVLTKTPFRDDGAAALVAGNPTGKPLERFRPNAICIGFEAPDPGGKPANGAAKAPVPEQGRTARLAPAFEFPGSICLLTMEEGARSLQDAGTLPILNNPTTQGGRP